jgi:hypothetical protein
LTYLPFSFFNCAAYWAWIFSVFDSFSRGFAFSSDQVHHQLCVTAQQKKYLPLRPYFLMLCCLVFFDLAIDTASGFLVGGPTLKEECMDDLDREERLDFEEDAL